LFIILFWYSRKPRPRAAVAALGMMMYGAFRFFVEFFREPDAHLADSLVFDWVTRGQILSSPMIVVGLLVFILSYHYAKSNKAGR
ncbi:MAG: phosphatidylglycerol:prolipoprotein diacylglycerol transferase, partial [Flavobacteriales bacterium]